VPAKKFNLLNLHSAEEDSNVRKLLRVYSLLPKFSKSTNLQMIGQAKRVVTFIRQANKKLKNEVGFSWKKKGIKMSGYSVLNI
jgi:hypothetical protein